MTDTYEQTIEPPLHQQLSRVDAPMERKRVGDMTVNKFAGLTFNEYRECIEFSKLMASAKNSVPAYLKLNPGDCLAIVTQSLRWRLEPFWVAQHSYVARAESLIAYDAAVHAAIVLSSGLLKGRPEYKWANVGTEEMTCTVTCVMREDGQILDYETPPLKKCRPPRNESGTVKGSPLWDKDPQQQLGYYAIRNWGRRHLPEVLGGVYDREEFEDTTQEETPVIPPTPNLMQRLPGKMEGAGFQTDVVDTGLAAEVKAEKEKAKEATEKAKDAPTEVTEPQTPAEAEKSTSEAPAASVPPPETAEQYVGYAGRWIEKGNDADNLEARWDGEKELRATVKLPLAARKRLEGMLKSQVAHLRTKKR